MTERKVDLPIKRASLKGILNSRSATAGLILCIAAFSQAALGQPASNEQVQWKQGIERPHRGWDYDGERILGHVGYDICLWDATTGKLPHRMKGHRERIQAVQFSPDGRHALSSSWVATGGMLMLLSRDTRVVVWDLTSGEARNAFQNHTLAQRSDDWRLNSAGGSRSYQQRGALCELSDSVAC